MFVTDPFKFMAYSTDPKNQHLVKSDKEKGKIMHLDQIVGQTNKYSQL